MRGRCGYGVLVLLLLALVVLPLFTRYLTPADYGAAETLLMALLVLALISWSVRAVRRFANRNAKPS